MEIRFKSLGISGIKRRNGKDNLASKSGASISLLNNL